MSQTQDTTLLPAFMAHPPRPRFRAMIVPDLLDRIEAVMGPEEGHRTDPAFLALAERIAGKEVELVFSGPDAFESQDDNYWLPAECWDIIGPADCCLSCDE